MNKIQIATEKIKDLLNNLVASGDIESVMDDLYQDAYDEGYSDGHRDGEREAKSGVGN